jgi:opacity protein-like surface antigen
MGLYMALIPKQAEAEETRYAGDPLLAGAGARSLGMGGAFVALADDATAAYWNPAGLAGQTLTEVQVQHAEQFGGTVNQDAFALARPTTVGGFGASILRLGVGRITLTDLEDPTRPPGPDNRPVVSRVAGAADHTVYLAYGRRATPSLSVGVALKMAWRRLGVGNGSGFGFDLGLLYESGTGIRAGLSVRNATRTRIHFDSGAEDRISPSLLIGLAYSRRFPALRGRVVWSSSAHLGEQKSEVESGQGLCLGTEYLYRDVLAFRIGVRDRRFTAGTGVHLFDRLAFDLAYLDHGELDNTYRISASLFF